MLSVIIPAYNENTIIAKTANAVTTILQNNKIEFEIIFVNDGSNDTTWECLSNICKAESHIKALSFSRNFGKEAAILAGLTYAKGDCCVVMDCDLQHPPQVIIEMYHLWEQGYQIVEGEKASRGKESKFHKFAANTFYKLISNATKIDMSSASDFKLLDRKAVNILINMPEKNPFFRALSSWIGFKTTIVEFDVADRINGQSKWSTKSLIKYALNNITSFSSAPLQLVTLLGTIFLLFSILLSVQTLFIYFSGRALEGFTTIIILLLLIGSVIMLSLGIIGYYIAKIYEEVKKRPQYIVSEIINNEFEEKE